MQPAQQNIHHYFAQLQGPNVEYFSEKMQTFPKLRLPFVARITSKRYLQNWTLPHIHRLMILKEIIAERLCH